MAEKIQIKKYRNRRLYDMAQKRYITLDELTELIQEGNEVQVTDATTGEDLTQTVLIQMILESQKSSEHCLFTDEFLHRLIQYRDQTTLDFFRRYLPSLLEGYVEWQRQTQHHFMNWAQLGWTQNPFSQGLGLWGDEGRESYKTSQTRRTGGTGPVEGPPEDVEALKKRIAELEALLKKSRKKA